VRESFERRRRKKGEEESDIRARAFTLYELFFTGRTSVKFPCFRLPLTGGTPRRSTFQRRRGVYALSGQLRQL